MERISATEAARNFSEILNRVSHRGQRFIIIRNGEEVASLQPVAQRATLRQLLELASKRVDREFADDVRNIQGAQPTLPRDPWES